VTSAALHLAAAALAAYLLGSIPFGLLLARLRGVEIRRVGSGNIGATNVWRCVGKTEGGITFLLDALKGYAGAALMPLLLGLGDRQGAVLLGACFAVVGHNFPVFLRFRGGKGVATSVGALLGVAPAAVGVGVAVWLAVLLASRFVSLASMAAALAIAVFVWVFRAPNELLRPVALSALAALAVLRHKSNIVRLARGTEHRVALGGKGR